MENSKKKFYYKKITCIISTVLLFLFALLIYCAPIIKLGDSNEFVTIVDFVQRLIKDESSTLYSLDKSSEVFFGPDIKNINIFIIIMVIPFMAICILLMIELMYCVIYILGRIINLIYLINISYEDYIEYLNSPEKLDYREKTRMKKFINSSIPITTLYVVALFAYCFILNIESVFVFDDNILRYCSASSNGILIFIVFGLYILVDMGIKAYLDYSENKDKKSVKITSSKILILLLCIITLIISTTHLFSSEQMGVSEKYSMIYFVNEILSLNISMPAEVASEYSSFFTKCGIGVLIYYIYLFTLISAVISVIISSNKNKKRSNLGFSIVLSIVGICFALIFKNILSDELFEGLIKLTGSATVMIVLPIIMVAIDVVVYKINTMGLGEANTPQQDVLNNEMYQSNPESNKQQINREINDYNLRVMNSEHNEYQRQTNEIPIYIKENSIDVPLNDQNSYNQFNQNNEFNTPKVDEQLNNENIDNNVQVNNDDFDNNNNQSNFEDIRQVINNGLNEEHNPNIDK